MAKRGRKPNPKPEVVEHVPESVHEVEAEVVPVAEPAEVESALVDEAVAEAEGLFSGDVPMREDVPEQAPCVPTIDEVVAKGFSPEKAKIIVAGIQAQEDGPDMLDDDGPFRGYSVNALRVAGFWAAGRKFGTTAQNIRIEDLSEADIYELDNANPLHLTVTRIGMDE